MLKLVGHRPTARRKVKGGKGGWPHVLKRCRNKLEARGLLSLSLALAPTSPAKYNYKLDLDS
eukprot:scaffold73953_cov32-Tisochrysis_lutea.AAC.3